MNLKNFAACAALACEAILGSLWTGNVLAAGAVAYAYEMGGGRRNYWAGNEANVQAAEKAAMASCEAGQKKFGHGRCAIAGSSNGPAYWAVSRADNGAVGYGASSERETAIKNAYETCSKLGKCAAAPAETWFDEGQTAKAAPAPEARTVAAVPQRQAIYRIVLPDGRVMYSDTPQRGAKSLP